MAKKKVKTDPSWDSLMFTVRDKGADFINIVYSGSGDEGVIDGVHFFSKQFVKGSIKEKDIESIIGINENDILTNLNTDCEKYEEEIKDVITDKILNSIENWYDDDGGQGEVWIDTKTGKYWCENGVNYTAVETHTHEGKL